MDNKYKRQEIHSFLDQNTKKDGKKNDQYCYGQLKFGDVQNKVRKISLKTFFGNPEFEIFCIRFDFEDQLIAAGCSDGTVKIFNIATGKLAFNLQGSSEGSTPTTSIRWRKDGANKVKSVVINVNSDGSIMFWHAQTGKQLHRLVEKNNQILCMDLRLDGEVFATSGRDCKIRIYDEEKKEIIHTFDSADYNQIGHLNRVFALKFLEEFPTTLLSCGWDGTKEVLDLYKDHMYLETVQMLGMVKFLLALTEQIINYNSGILVKDHQQQISNGMMQILISLTYTLANLVRQTETLYWQAVVGNKKSNCLTQMIIIKFVDGFESYKKAYIVLITGINQTNLHLEVEKEQSTFVN
ncbi:unnamed protein product [Paramecium octaurelia]|uniref:Anaphase-promoting complex subunit 4-like WD40 domain-containing protein n=1 Tax=Paramecium octaurelia TaxID=43137 RepID=A0A8S1VPC7_PAROT|nr:unnamed protein product [Paramecium octaurelia]